MRFFFFFNDTATTEIYTLSLHDALPICLAWRWKCTDITCSASCAATSPSGWPPMPSASTKSTRSEEHTSELQSQSNLVCRLLLEKKNEPPPHRDGPAQSPPPVSPARPDP